MVTVLLTTTAAGARLLSCEKLQLSPVDRSMIKLVAVMAKIPLLIFSFSLQLLSSQRLSVIMSFSFWFFSDERVRQTTRAATAPAPKMLIGIDRFCVSISFYSNSSSSQRMREHSAVLLGFYCAVMDVFLAAVTKNEHRFSAVAVCVRGSECQVRD